MDNTTLSNEIASAFPMIEMPVGSDLSFHKSGCFECDYLRKELEHFRGKEITGETIRLVHQEMSCLSANAWSWILPHYLRFCLTEEAVYNQMETEFLIYNLGPDLKFQEETLQRLSALNKAQIACLIHFLKWCSNHEFWNEYCPEDIKKAMIFLGTVNA